MIYFDIDHLLNVTQFLQFLQRFDLSDDLLFLVEKTYICFASATYAKQTGLPPHLFTTMAEGETLSGPPTYCRTLEVQCPMPWNTTTTCTTAMC